MFDNNKAFIWYGKEKILKPVKRVSKQQIEELLFIDKQKNLLIANTKKFIEGKRVNNVLLWGERGTGKTTLIKGLINYLNNSPLRLIQVYKSEISTLPELYDLIFDHSSFRFIIFIDDLSFRENEQDFIELKIVMDGGIEEVPENSVIYATSNRRNLISFNSQVENELFPDESLQERISLIERFGLRIGFFRFSQEQYYEIVKHHAKQNSIDLAEDKLLKLAHEWALTHGTSGRSAYQFILTLNMPESEFV